MNTKFYIVLTVIIVLLPIIIPCLLIFAILYFAYMLFSRTLEALENIVCPLTERKKSKREKRGRNRNSALVLGLDESQKGPKRNGAAILKKLFAN